MIKKTLVPAVAAALLLSACVTDNGTKQTVGTLGGAAGGALLGSQIGGGSGRLVAVGVGTLVGAFLGSEIGKSLDRADQLAANRAAQQAHAAPIGQTISWNNPDSGHSGSVTPVRDGYASSGAYCREYQQTITVGGRTERAYGTACQQADGSWKIVD